MIRYENATREVAFGRHTQRLETKFLLRTLPSWLATDFNGDLTWENNGLVIPATATSKLTTAYFDVEQMTQISAEFFNLNFHSDSTTASIRMTSEDGTREFGIYANPTDLSCKFEYRVTGTAVISDADMGYVGSIRKFRFMAFTDASGSVRHGNAPRNLRLSVFPVEREISVIENGVTAYTLNSYIHPDGADVADIDFSGRWRFEIEFSNTLSLSGAEIKIQQNV